MKRVTGVTLAALLVASLGSSEEDTRSLAERAAEAAARARRKPTSSDKVLTNDDLKKAKGNVIFLSATPTPPPTPPPAVREAPVPVFPGAISEQREAAARLRGSIEEAQRQLAVATPEQRTALEQRLLGALDDLARTHEAIGALSERARLGDNHVPSSE